MNDETFGKHRTMVCALAKPGAQILSELNPKKVEAWHHASCIPGEAGELFDAVKKWVIYNGEVDYANVIEELGDLEFYLEGLRQVLGITRVSTIQANIDKLSKRYPNFEYANDRALNRADKQ